MSTSVFWNSNGVRITSDTLTACSTSTLMCNPYTVESLRNGSAVLLNACLQADELGSGV